MNTTGNGMGVNSPGVLDTSAPVDADAESDALERLIQCPMCRSQLLDLQLTARDTLHGLAGEWGVVRCRDCGLMHTSPRPTRRTMASYYPEEYKPHSENFVKATSGGARGIVKRLLSRVLDPREVVLPRPLSPGTALEVGCGSGRFLVQLADRGWHVHGLEPSAAAVTRLRAHRDLPVTVGTIETTDFDPRSFDLIVASMVFEHLHDPLGDVMKLRSWLRPGGHLTGSVPNCASWEFRFFASEWYALQVPTHLFHYTPTTLTNLLERAGLRRIRIYHQRNVSNLLIHLGRTLERNRLPFAQTCLEFPKSGSRSLRLAVRPVASLLAWLRQAGRISFLADGP